MSASPALAARNLRVVRGGRAVLHVDALDVAPGEVVAVIGPNGAGKSTLLLAAALLLPFGGDLRLLGAQPSRRDSVRLRRQTGTVFQDAALLDMTARANVETTLALHGVPRRDRRARAMRWLERLGIAHRAETRAHQLSGGEAQRVSLARAFAVEPRLLFLDEPFSALDEGTRSQLIGDVRALLGEEGTAVLMTTHDRAEAELLADRVVVLLDGRVARTGTAADVFAQPGTADVARFLGFAVVPAAAASRLAGVEIADGEAAIPPSAVRLAEDGIEARVTAVRGAPEGAEVVVEAAGASLLLRLSVAELRARSLDAGARVAISVDGSRIAWL